MGHWSDFHVIKNHIKHGVYRDWKKKSVLHVKEKPITHLWKAGWKIFWNTFVKIIFPLGKTNAKRLLINFLIRFYII